MDEKGRLIYQLLDFEKFVGTTDHFSKGIREIVRRYSHVTLQNGPGDLCYISAEFNYKEVPEDEILALIDSSAFSLRTIETVLQAKQRAHTEFSKRKSPVISEAVNLFRYIGIQMSYDPQDNPDFTCEVLEIPKRLSNEELVARVSTFVVLCKLYLDYPLVFSRYRPLDDDEPAPLARAFIHILSLIEKSSGSETLTRGAAIGYAVVALQKATSVPIRHDELEDTREGSLWEFVTKSDVPYTELDIQLEHLAHRYGYNKENVIDLRNR